MKHSSSIILLLALLLTACSPAADETIINASDDFIRQYGDDVVRIASQSEDDVARQSTQYSDDVIRYWDAIVREAPQTVEKVPSRLIYRTTSHLYPEQEYLLEKLQTNLALTVDEAAVYLQGACSIASWAAVLGDYPLKALQRIM
jgi:hypothetical protein